MAAAAGAAGSESNTTMNNTAPNRRRDWRPYHEDVEVLSLLVAHDGRSQTLLCEVCRYAGGVVLPRLVLVRRHDGRRTVVPLPADYFAVEKIAEALRIAVETSRAANGPTVMLRRRAED